MLFLTLIEVKVVDISSTKQACTLMNRICSCKNSTEHHCVLRHAPPSWYGQAAGEEAHEFLDTKTSH